MASAARTEASAAATAAGGSAPPSRSSAVSVAFMEDGEIVFAEAYGSAHPDEQVPVTPEEAELARKEFGDCGEVQHMIEFFETSKRGVIRRTEV